MKRTHISKAALKKIRREMQPQTIDRKPLGFWYGIDGDWERWCRAEQWGLASKSFEYEVALGKERILLLSSVAELDDFHANYAANPYKGLAYLEYIDWRRVAKEYDGIEITPYQWDRRLDGKAHNWYYGWDCASGCIWQPKGGAIVLVGEIVA